jgi:hypothetical protein
LNDGRCFDGRQTTYVQVCWLLLLLLLLLLLKAS